jgi:hypothetical protein
VTKLTDDIEAVENDAGLRQHFEQADVFRIRIRGQKRPVDLFYVTREELDRRGPPPWDVKEIVAQVRDVAEFERFKAMVRRIKGGTECQQP